ncbi:hypothetical protein ACGF07_11085 [Kitasatospora sp. NPDC048194]|uniref:hypothetical protein n=1 Tax=Kitasatospora sp. NPDC048194 TaxID=3364045 RepID=UPI003711092D
MSAVAIVAAAVSAGEAARELRWVELGFAGLLSGCALTALALLGTWRGGGR